MADTFLTQYELERKIKMLRFNQTESSNIDAKVTLNLKSDGDCAELIRDIVAFANTGQQCHIIVGIVNKTWVSKGIPEDSPLFDADKTQHQLNQVLANKLDPPLA
jgi:predicted HTH transcriptional regulator